MAYRNKQFLLASQRYYQGCQGTNHRDPCDDTDACQRPERDPCQCKGHCNCHCNGNGYPEGDVCPDRTIPETIIDILCSLISEQVEVTTPFGVITGFLLDVKRDYVVILEDNGDQVLVRTAKIESVSPIT